MPRHNNTTPRFLRAAIAAKVKGKTEAQVLNAAKRVGFDGPPWRLSLRMQACVMRAAMDAYIADKPIHEIYKAARAAGFQGREADVWFLLQQGTDMPRILWKSTTPKTTWRAREETGRTSANEKRATPKLFVVRANGSVRRLPYNGRRASDTRKVVCQSQRTKRKTSARTSLPAPQFDEPTITLQGAIP